ncbi:unnamed protein product [Penicillium salamii]|uniref:Uncharacterized protein n=1 Tax=Penicillium salamii TaxID=1612424 RepID=A0A9W4K0X7_9EURO|nr:unnamed protein product [Penicillium salamii]CAG8198726.1 unnamed protein product [Penicillium salamii]CAG8235737.1 unnamed protein product [Penicillium salamii]CAG8383728.1 unnamed protein product [Penicillium salamii]CAG8402625.1 unnamed protein product [Penicillium salamii]
MRNSHAVLCIASLVSFQGTFAHPLSSIGNMGILNNCETAVYLMVTREWDFPVRILDPGELYQERYQFSTQGGTSMKLANSTDDLQNGKNQVQLEYTCTDRCYVDMSLINNDAKFPGHNTTLSLRPSNSSCDTLTCIAGDTTCRDAYFIPTDDHAVRACSLEASWILTLCAKPLTR